MANGQLGSVLAFLRRAFGGPDADAQTDRELLRRFAEHQDQDAFAALVRRHGPMVLAVCRRVLNDAADVEDAFQATFVVLARKAGSVGWQPSASSWLYQVAYRVASKARVAGALRRRHERQVRDMSPTDTLSRADQQELRLVLDEELSRLPEKYRAPLVLCYLEGRTNDEAAELLGWTKGTVSGRLARARDLLRTRLTRRNLAISAAALTAALSENTAPAAVPAALFDLTLQAAALPAAGVLPAPVANLAEGVLHAMFMTKVKSAAILFLTVGVLSAGAYQFERSHGTSAQASLVPVRDEEPEPRPQPNLSEPVVKDGLAVTVQAVKAVFAKHEMPSFKVVFKNESKEPMLLYKEARVWDTSCQPSIEGPFGTYAVTFPVDRKDILTVPRSSDSQLLAPGDSLDAILKGEGFRQGDHSRELLPAGTYRVTVRVRFTKNPAEALFKHNHWVGELTTKSAEFAVGDPKATLASKPALVNGVEFQALTDRTWPLPAANKSQQVAIALRLINQEKSKRIFLNLFRVSLCSADGKEIQGQCIVEQLGMPRPVDVEAGTSAVIPQWGNLTWLKEGKTLRLSFGSTDGGQWTFDGLLPGKKYQLILSYANEKQVDQYWVGKAQTEMVEVSVADETSVKTSAKAIELAQPAAEKALAAAYEQARKTPEGKNWPTLATPWLGGFLPQVAETFTGWRITWDSNDAISFYSAGAQSGLARFTYKATVEVDQEGTVKVQKATASYKPR